MALRIHQFPCLSDNYAFLVHDEGTGQTACIDTPDAEAINDELHTKGWDLTHILNTHHHWDHTGGNLALKEKWKCQIIGPHGEADKIPGIDREVVSGDTVEIGSSKARILETPGHTRGHIIYHFSDDSVAFVGDTLFAMGCGRLFEGTPEMMWTSLKSLRSLPDDSVIYCAHEYTLANAVFAVTIEPQNQALQDRLTQVRSLREQSQPTIPTFLAIEKETNPFLRADNHELQVGMGLRGADPVEVFAEIRSQKDNFKS